MTTIVLLVIAISTALTSSGASTWFLVRKLRDITKSLMFDNAFTREQLTGEIRVASTDIQCGLSIKLDEAATDIKTTVTNYLDEHRDHLHTSTEELKAHAKHVADATVARSASVPMPRVKCSACDRTVVKFDLVEGAHKCLDCIAKGSS